jgi:hypothetical protein
MNSLAKARVQGCLEGGARFRVDNGVCVFMMHLLGKVGDYGCWKGLLLLLLLLLLLRSMEEILHRHYNFGLLR